MHFFRSLVGWQGKGRVNPLIILPRMLENNIYPPLADLRMEFQGRLGEVSYAKVV